MQPELRSFVSVLRSLSRHLKEAKRRMRTVSKSATFLATESVNSAPFKRAERGANFWQRKSAKLIANFSATKVTSLPSISLCISLSLSLSLSHRAHLTHNIGSASALPIIKKTSHRFKEAIYACLFWCKYGIIHVCQDATCELQIDACMAEGCDLLC